MITSINLCGLLCFLGLIALALLTGRLLGGLYRLWCAAQDTRDTTH